MYERFTDRARKVLQLANQEAQRFRHEYIGTEHILLGLIEEGSGVAANVLKNLDIDVRKLRREVEKIVQAGPGPVSSGRMPQTPRAKKVLEYAIEEARNLGHNYVGTEHMLIGLSREEEGLAAQILVNLGLSLSMIRAEVQQLLGVFPDEPIRQGVQPEPADPVPRPAPEGTPRIEQAVSHLEAVMRLLNEIKEDAVTAQDFEWAAHLRDQADKLRKMKDWLVRERRREDMNRS